MARLQKSGVEGKLGPVLNEERDLEYWYARRKTATSRRSENWPTKKPQGVTVDYDELLKTWKAPVKKG